MMIIWGAGMAGLLAANVLRRFDPVIWEKQSSLPDNHGALLRFRSDAVAKTTGQPFKKVRVTKAIFSGGRLRNEATLRDNNQYSYKVTGTVRGRSILNLEAADRYIAPDNFIAEMARGIPVQYNTEVGKGDVHTEVQSYAEHDSRGPILSTLPMPVMMNLVGWEDKPEFTWLRIWSVKCDIEHPPVDVYQTIYFPNLDIPFYRASITGRHLILEYAQEPEEEETDVWAALEHFSIPVPITSGHSFSSQKYGKLAPIDDRVRKRFIVHLTNKYGIYSIGRFATWRQIILDDVVKDANLIGGWIEKEDHYGRHLHGRNV